MQDRSTHYRSIFISDLHIGAKAFDAEAFLNFLKAHTCETIYLVGDIFDGWKLSKRWFWRESYSQILDEITRKRIEENTKIILITGNHDEELRWLNPITKKSFAQSLGVTIRNKIIHRSTNNQKFLVMHGDQFDRKILRGPLSKWGDQLYDLLLDFLQDHKAPPITIHGEEKQFSLAKFLKVQSQKALSVMNNFENLAARAAKRNAMDGIICGHTHIPTLKQYNGVVLANCGDWLRTGHTALVETKKGALKLLDWPSSYDHPELFDPLYQDKAASVFIRPDAYKYRPLTLKAIEKIKHIWPTKPQYKAQKVNHLERTILKNPVNHCKIIKNHP